ncbi:tryptophan synthase subunit alpha, partial [Priestia megaterium]|uniref:tryptophan synthase subunit alpha n=1 Tax=Priestia megaterium TaxID=1404 RepID=UPI0035B57EBD
PASAAAVARFADAVVVGSALVRQIEQHRNDPQAMREALGGLLAQMREAMDQARTQGEGA